ncbi:hypothetical protein Clacol_007648 [Clathrus columnatus]|uniref:Uncharacterized protein n=1 Tax=Clathrus columnatus TaxID=1419009 RepID=A0AAV5AFH2_9AGAM|nr:hypothetical protein Clacol_007648 [Clathrus columnatus]
MTVFQLQNIDHPDNLHFLSNGSCSIGYRGLNLQVVQLTINHTLSLTPDLFHAAATSMEAFHWDEVVDSDVAFDFDAYIDVPSLVDVRARTLNTYTDSSQSQQKVVNTDIGNDVHTSCNNFRHSSNQTISDSLNGNLLRDNTNLHTSSFPQFPVTPFASTGSDVFNSYSQDYSINPEKTIIKRPKTGRALLYSPSPAFRFARPHTPSQSSKSPSPLSSTCNSDATIAPVTSTYPSNSTINVTFSELLKILEPNIRREYEDRLIELQYSLRTEYNAKNEIEVHRVREECRVEFEALLQERMKELKTDYETRVREAIQSSNRFRTNMHGLELDEARIEFEATLKERMEEVQAICNETVEERDEQLTRLKKKLQRGTIQNIRMMMMENRKMSTRSRERKQKEERWRTEVIRVERPGRNMSLKEIVTCEERQRLTSDVSSIPELEGDDNNAYTTYLSDSEIDEPSPGVPIVLGRGDNDDTNTKYLSEGEIDETSPPIASIPPAQDLKLNEAEEKKFIFGLQLEYALERARRLDALEETRACREKITGLEKRLQGRWAENRTVTNHSDSPVDRGTPASVLHIPQPS